MNLCRRLESEICTISIGGGGVILKAHRAVLAQSPILCLLLKHRYQSNHSLHIEFPSRDPAVFCRILHYLYSQTLPATATKRAEGLEQLCDTYIMACNLELDILQELIIRSLDESEINGMCESFPHATYKVYQAGQARAPFRDFFKYAIKKNIPVEGCESNDYFRRSVETLVSHGGLVALDVARAIMDITQEKDETTRNMASKGEESRSEATQDKVPSTFTRICASVAGTFTSKKQTENQPLGTAHTSGEQHSEEQGLHEEKDVVAASKGLVAIASESQSSNFDDDLDFEQGDRITNIASHLLLLTYMTVADDHSQEYVRQRSRHGGWGNFWFGSCSGRRGKFVLDSVEDPSELESLIAAYLKK